MSKYIDYDEVKMLKTLMRSHGITDESIAEGGDADS